MFTKFQTAIHARIQLIGKFPLFEVDYSRDEIFEFYLDAFRPEDNPIFRERREYDCSCCKSFIRQMGGMVAIDPKGKVHTIWGDLKGLPEKYKIVADAMNQYILSKPIVGVFKRAERHIGTQQNNEVTSEGIIVWNHFYSPVPASARSSDGDRLRGESASWKDSLERSILELQDSHLEDLLQVCKDKNLYQWDLRLPQLQSLKKVKAEYAKAKDKETFLWLKSQELRAGSTIRNSVIGQVLVNMAKGDSLETAVGKYEAMTAPANYKRSKSLVTPAMIKKAHQTVQALGMEDSLLRRHATVDDLTINNVIFADNSIRESLGAFDILGTAGTVAPVNQSRIQDAIKIPVQTFLKDVVTKATKLEVMMTPNQQGNLMSLVAPVNQSAPNMLKWNNNFSWTYNGEVADSMAEQVKAHGGKIDGDLRFSIRWNENNQYPRDLDAHCKGPSGHIYYSNKTDRTGGRLDVDIVSPGSKVAVENITWPNVRKMRDGEYKFYINDFSGGGNANWEAEIEFEGQVFSFSGTIPRGSANMDVATVTLRNGKFSISNAGSVETSSREYWGVSTYQFTPVKAISLSPNHWDENQNGSKHYFFFLEGCVNPDSARGFYNEFLADSLYEHRKVFEHLGSKLKAPYSDQQMSGLGFSSTKSAEVIVKADHKIYKVII
ncbi:DNA-directed RNA polymerase [Vibrio phage vB_VhaP_PG11]|nr:DNA-directed RNA polymerase [Vibrio phage vB_VhaP_PG11]